jgi:hypothetical protein
MNSSNLAYKPVVNYTGSVDTSDLSGNYGSTIFSVYYDASLVTLGNLLMFEYKIEKEGVIQDIGVITTSDNSNVGIINQWSVSVPALSNIYDPSMNISIRAYIGQYTTDVIGVTEWSIPLKLYNPPPQPEIKSAYYDHVSSDASGILQSDDLYVFLKSGTYPPGVKFVVAYNYTDPDNMIKWGISPPLPVDVSNQLIVQNFGEVNISKKFVYVSVYAVYTVDVKVDDSSVTKNIYTMSRISKTFEAKPILDQPASQPEIIDLIYNVYNTKEQTMTVNWKAPVISSMSTFQVTGYRLEMSDDNFATIDASHNRTPPFLTNSYSINVDVSDYACGKTVYFRVIAKFNGGESISSTIYKQIFRYSDSPQGLDVLYASYISATNSLAPATDSSMNISVRFKNPDIIGCGLPQYFIVKVYDTSGNRLNGDLDTVNYVNREYYTTAVKTRYSKKGYVTVNLLTEDTNNSNTLLNGATAQDEYISSSIPIFNNIAKTANALTFNVNTYTPLTDTGTINLPNRDGRQFQISNRSTPPTILANGAYQYSFTFEPREFSKNSITTTNSGQPITIGLSNASGTNILPLLV